MQWTDSLSVGVQQIDDQHKALIKAVNDLFEACKEGKGRQKISETLDFAEKYVVFHFGDEEKLQLKVGYPGYKEHKILHDAFVGDIRKYANEFEKEGPNIALVARFNAFISNWLIKHISIEDKKIGAYIKETNQ